MKKTIIVQPFQDESFKGKELTIGLDLGDRWSFYCVMDEAGQIILEQKLPTTSEAMKQTCGKIPRSLITWCPNSVSSRLIQGECVPVSSPWRTHKRYNGSPRAVGKMIGTMRRPWRLWRESIPNCWG